MRKTIGFILTLALAAGMLTGCGKNEGNVKDRAQEENISGGVLTL